MSTLSLYFSVSLGIQKTHQFSMRQNIKKDINYVLYQGTVEEEDVPCSYVGSTEINPGANIKITHKESEVEENSSRVFFGENFSTSNNFVTTSADFLLTDVFANFVIRRQIPLYWKHILPSASIDPNSVKIVDRTLSEVPKYSYEAIRHNSYDESTGTEIDGSYASCAVYSNYRNTYDNETGDANFYFVYYEATDGSHYDLLNQEPVYKEATWEDVWSLTNSLKPWEKVYQISPGTEGFLVTASDPNTTYALKINTEGRIFVKDFFDLSDQEPWFPRISNGSFTRYVNDEKYYYSVPEFSSQTFNPVSPYKSIVGETALRIRGDLYKLDAAPLKVDSSFYVMDVVIKNRTDQVLYALTTDTSKNGEFYYYNGERVYREIEVNNAWVSWDSTGIVSWDQQSGFIHLKDDYPDNYVCEVSYYFKEKYLQYTGVNVNPVFDEEDEGHFYVLYIVPTSSTNGNVETQTSAIHYLKVNESGQITETSQDSSSGNFDLSSVVQTDGQYIHYSRLAQGVTLDTYSAGNSWIVISLEEYNDFPDTGVLVIGDSDINNSSTQIVGYTSLVKDVSNSKITISLASNLTATVNAATLVRLFSFEHVATTSTSFIGTESLFSDSPTRGFTIAVVAGDNGLQWFVLAKIETVPTQRPDMLSVIDVRETGGVIRKEQYASANIIDPRAVWARPQNIISRGQPVPGESVAVIRIPYIILSDYGGTFRKEEVEDLVKKHIAVGVMPVVIYHGAIPEITSATQTTSAVTLCWESEGTDYSYYIYQGSIEDGPWTKVNATAIEDQDYGNCYTVTGLSSNTVYYFTVTSLSSDGIEGPHSIPWGVKTKAD